MSDNLTRLRNDLRQAANPQKAKNLQRFFKTGKGEYAEGDQFLGVMVPQTRTLVKKYWQETAINDAKKLLASEFHEERLLALLILVKKFEKAGDPVRKKIFDLYLANTKHINNWDLVDLTAPNIIGAYLENKNREILFRLAKSSSLWERRIAVLATFWFIKNGDARDALAIAEILVCDEHDLIHKAVGWMLREIGKRGGQEVEEKFLQKYCRTMPRTMLRYAIEHFDFSKRKHYLSGGAGQK